MSSNEPVKNGCEVIYEMFHILERRFEILDAVVNCNYLTPKPLWNSGGTQTRVSAILETCPELRDRFIRKLLLLFKQANKMAQ